MAITQTVPLVGGNKTTRNAVAVFVCIAKLELPAGMALFSGKPRPLNSFFIVKRYAIAVVVHAAKLGLRIRIALLSGELIPLCSLGIVAGDIVPIKAESLHELPTFSRTGIPVKIHVTQSQLRSNVALFGG